MKKNRSVLFAAFLFASMLILSSCKSCTKSSNASIPYDIVSISDTSTYADVDISYPQFEKLSTLNKSIEHTVLEERYAEFMSTVQERWQEINAAHKAMGASEDLPPLEYIVSCEPIINGPDYISMLFTTYVYTGGAHGETLLESLTYDVAAQKMLSITDISNLSLNEIATYCNEHFLQTLNYGGEDVESQDSRKDWIAEGTAPEEYNYQIFTFDGTTLTVYFEPYIVAPYAYGVQKVEIPIQ
ncbi:MAG: DUF3298 and DUF4163 domain-containing protein [Treponema sp.]|nr:DUF3298 and DUF4163 domain-containing protein [Treponema sp.]